jgi:FlaA1/EpsC-like NDP-sugar epimerase
VFADYRPDFVFHAAAYKHVPMLEANVREAVRNNVVGTRNVVESALRHQRAQVRTDLDRQGGEPVERDGGDQTHRGADSARVIGHAKARRSFAWCGFGNVLGSDGSVIPLFPAAARRRQPLTVTHPEARRYFMTIPEAVQLVLQAAVVPEAAGRISMLEMGEPVRILYLPSR